MKRQAHRIRQRPHHQCLRQARHTFQQAVTAGQNGDQQLLNHVFLADYNAANLFANLSTGFNQFHSALLIADLHRSNNIRHEVAFGLSRIDDANGGVRVAGD